MKTLICRLEELEQLCNLPKRTATASPAFDACLGQQLQHDNTLKTVVRIDFECQPGKVCATLR